MKRRIPTSPVMGAFCLVCLIVAFFSKENPGLTSWLWNCPVRVGFDVPCFSCGITRTFKALASGEVLHAITLSPLPFLVVTCSIACGFWWLVAKLSKKVTPDELVGRWLLNPRFRVGVVLVFFALWGYAIVRSQLTGAP